MLVLLYGYENNFFFHGLYGYENKEFFHVHINTQTIVKFPDKLMGKRAPPRELQLQQYHHVRRLYSSRAAVQIQRIASLHLAETLRPTALPRDGALHLYITCKLLLCVRLGISRDRRCGQTLLRAMLLT